VSSRSYLRARECTYNLDRFLEAVPQAELVAGTRSVRRAARRPSEPDPPLPPRLRLSAPVRLDREVRNAGR
jgi:hypothetical protein